MYDCSNSRATDEKFLLSSLSLKQSPNSQNQPEINRHYLGRAAGAILAERSEVRITGNATFSFNSARRDGGEKLYTNLMQIWSWS